MLTRQNPDVPCSAGRVLRVSRIARESLQAAAKSMWFHVRMDDVSAPWTFH
jgi:hypothetical protein